MQLDMLSPDLAGQVKDLQNYEFTSSEARERFEELLDQLRQQLTQSYFNQMAGAMSEISPEDMARMKDMLVGPQRDARAAPAGRGARLRPVHGALRRLLPREPREPRRAARDHGRAHGRHAGDAQLDDARAAGPAAGPVRAAHGGHGPALADGPARTEPAEPLPPDGLEPQLRLQRPGPARVRRGGPDDAGARRHRPAREPAAWGDHARRRWPRSTSTGPASCWATSRPRASTGCPSWPACSRRPA